MLLSCVKHVGNYNLKCFVLPQAIGVLQLLGSCLVSSYFGTITCTVLLSVKLLWNYILQGFASPE